jgi:hypothetical protein
MLAAAPYTTPQPGRAPSTTPPSLASSSSNWPTPLPRHDLQQETARVQARADIFFICDAIRGGGPNLTGTYGWYTISGIQW